MANNSSANIGFEKQIWEAACELWGHIPAADYRKVIIGLIFLRYIGNAFENQYNKLVADGDGFEDDPDAYEAENIFFVPEAARWSKIAAAAHKPEIGTVIDNAMRAIEEDNKKLKNVLPKNFASPDLDKRVLGNVVDLFTNMNMDDTEESKDLLGRTYEYCIAQFAAYEGVKGGEFYTPASIVKTIVAVLRPFSNCRVYDPCCGSGGMFVQSAKFIQAHSNMRGVISVYGQESNADTWKMAKMNLAIRGIDANLGEHQADTFFNDIHGDSLKADFIMANPPFNLSNWGQDKLKDDKRWKYGLPPAGNANYAWIQHMIHHLAPNGKMGVVLANTALSISTGEEYEIRKKIIDDNLVEAIVALPAHLFYATKIKVSIWFINKKKKRTETLFIDARNMGRMVNRTIREIGDKEISLIADTIHKFQDGEAIREKVGFCKVASLEEIKGKKYNISPSKYISGNLCVDEIGDFEIEYDDDLKVINKCREEIYACEKTREFYHQVSKNSFDEILFKVGNADNDIINKVIYDSEKMKKNKIILKKKIIELSEKLFKYWFIDYNFYDKNGEPYKNNGGALKTTLYGEIPADWKVIPFGEILSNSTDKVGSLVGIPEYSTTNLGILPRANKFNKTLTNNSSKNKLIRCGDIVFGMSREILNFGVMCDEVGSVSPAYHVYHIDAKTMNPEFLEIYMRICADYFLSLIKPGAREGQVLDKDELSRKLILCPPVHIQQKFIILRNYLLDYIG